MKKIPLFILALFISVLCFSQYSDLYFSNLNTENGLSQSWIRCIYQDEYGFMWFGTKDGLNRYDGYNFKVFRYEEKNPYSINDVTINKILKTQEGDMLVGTASGVDLYIREKEHFVHLDYLPKTEITCMMQDHNRNLWFGTDIGLYKFDVTDSSLIHFQYDKDEYNSLSNDYVAVIYEDSQNNIWIGTRHGLNLLNNNAHTFTRYLTGQGKNAISSDYIFDIIEDNKNRLWIASMSGGVDLFLNWKERPEEGIFRNYLKGSAWSFCIDRNNHMWIGRGGGRGLVILNLNSVDEDEVVMYEYKNEPGNNRSLSDNSIDCVYEDRWGDIWLGTYGKGINYYSQRSKKFNTVKHTSGKKSTLSNNHINTFLEDDNYLWIGTEVGLNQYNKSTGEYKHFLHNPDNPHSLGANAVYALYRDSRDNLWVGTWDGGLNKYNKDGSFTRYKHVTEDINSISSDNVFSIYEDDKGNLWIGTIEGGLCKFNYSTNKFIRYQHNPSDTNSLYTYYVNSVTQTGDGNLWISTHDALDLYLEEEDRFHHYTREQFMGQGMSNADIIALYCDSKDQLWLGTEGGLIYFNRQEHLFVRYTTEHGLPNNSIKGILEDSRGNLWISTNNGLSKFIDGIKTPLNPVFRNYNRKDGIQGNEFVKRSAYKSKNGVMYFGGTDGFTYFKPEEIRSNKIVPPVILTDFLLFNKSVREYGKGSPLQQSISTTKEITLNYKQSVFSFEFAALNYLNSEKNQYRYKLDGFDENWNNVGNQRTATYTNLNPGNYTFLLQGSNNDGVWNKEGVSVQIFVLPPWWKTTFFRVSLAVVLFILLISLYRFRMYRLHNQKMVLEKKVKERTKALSEANTLLEEKQEEITMQNEELANHRNNLEYLVEERTAELLRAKEKAEESEKLKSSFLANMSHEIRTPMNAIVGFAALLREDDLEIDEKNEYLNIIEKNSESLLVLINDILEISLLESNQIKINKAEFEVNEVLDELEKYYSLRNDKNLDIKYIRDNAVQKLVLKNDVVRFRQIFSNLLNNAYKYTEQGYIHFGFEMKDNEAVFYVEDSGIGIEQKEFENIFNYFQKIDMEARLYRGTGIGLSITRSLVGLMGGKIWLDSEIGKGSVFYFTLPSPIIRPAEKGKEQKSSKNKKLSINFKGYQILVAEDEMTNFKLIEKILIPTKAKIIWARNGSEALEFTLNVKNQDKLIVLMDIKMPVMNGIEALKEIKKHNTHIPVIAVTAYANNSERRKIMNNDFSDYLAKPLKPIQLLEVISKFIA